MKLTTLTSHALENVFKRTSLLGAEVAKIIDEGITTPIGVEKGSRRVHILFYSPVDGECFVAVQDERTREIVTVLPPDFDRHCKVPPDAIYELLFRHGVFPLERNRA